MCVVIFPLGMLILMFPMPVAWKIVLSAVLIACGAISLKVVKWCQLGNMWPDMPEL